MNASTLEYALRPSRRTQRYSSPSWSRQPITFGNLGSIAIDEDLERDILADRELMDFWEVGLDEIVRVDFFTYVMWNSNHLKLQLLNNYAGATLQVSA
jgi:hypothetical protein